jgi:hypothetical protein
MNSINVTLNNKSVKNVKSVAVRFGPHFNVNIWGEKGKVRFSLVATHHGFQADANEISGELEKMIMRLREEFPHNRID